MASDKQPIPATPESLNKEALTKIVVPSMLISDILDEWVEKSNSVDILVAGKMGTGKSTLINGIVGKSVAKEGDKLSSETHKVQEYVIKINAVAVSIFDTPGLQDHASVNEDLYIAGIQAKCSDIDLFLYCIRMSETRFTAECDDFVAMRRLTKALGMDLWKNGLIVFTFANDVIEMVKHKLNPSESFRKQFEKASEKLRVFLQDEIKLDPEIVSEVTIVCAGYNTTPTLPSVSTQVPDDIHWLSYLWLKALYKTKLRAQPALVKLNVGRIKSEEYFAEEKQQATSEITDFPPIMLNKAGKIFGQVVGSEELGAVVGDATSQQLVSEIKRCLGIKSSENFGGVWMLVTIAISPEGPVMKTSESTIE